MSKTDPYGNCISFKIDKEIKKNKNGHRTQTIHFWMPDLRSKDLVKEKTRDMKITRRYKFKSNCHGLIQSQGERDVPNEETKHDAYVKAKYIAKVLAKEAGIDLNKRRRKSSKSNSSSSKKSRPMRHAVYRMPPPPPVPAVPPPHILQNL